MESFKRQIPNDSYLFRIRKVIEEEVQLLLDRHTTNRTSFIMQRKTHLVNTVAPHVRCCIQNLENIEEAVQISKCFDSLSVWPW